MSRSQWCCLVAALAVVLGLFCGPSTAAAAPDRDPAPVTAVVAVDGGGGIPGCGRSDRRDGTEPAVPARAAHDQAPGLAEGGLPAATGPEPCRAPAPMTPRGPEATAPGPVELSVLRV